MDGEEPTYDLQGLTIGLHPNCRQHWNRRRWNGFASLAEKLYNAGASVLLTGSPDDSEYVAEILGEANADKIVCSYIPTSSVMGLARLLKRLDIFVTINTLPMHLAIALKVPTVAIVGGTPASVVCPRNNPRLLYVEDPGLANYPDYRPQIDNIRVGVVIDKIQELIHAIPVNQTRCEPLPC